MTVFFVGEGGLEPPNSSEDRFTVCCNCRYATPPAFLRCKITENSAIGNIFYQKFIKFYNDLKINRLQSTGAAMTHGNSLPPCLQDKCWCVRYAAFPSSGWNRYSRQFRRYNGRNHEESTTYPW